MVLEGKTSTIHEAEEVEDGGGSGNHVSAVSRLRGTRTRRQGWGLTHLQVQCRFCLQPSQGFLGTYIDWNVSLWIGMFLFLCFFFAIQFLLEFEHWVWDSLSENWFLGSGFSVLAIVVSFSLVGCLLGLELVFFLLIFLDDCVLIGVDLSVDLLLVHYQIWIGFHVFLILLLRFGIGQILLVLQLEFRIVCFYNLFILLSLVLGIMNHHIKRNRKKRSCLNIFLCRNQLI